MKLQVLLVAWALTASGAGSNRVSDPITDFLSLPIESRFSEVGDVTRVSLFYVDLDGDHREDVFVGHAKPWGGDSRTLYWCAYRKLAQDYVRLLPPDQDLEATFAAMDRSCIFVGLVKELQHEAMLVLEYDPRRDPSEPGKLLPPVQYTHRRVYWIQGDYLVVADLGPMSLETEEGKAFYGHYFGKDVASRSVRYDSLTAYDLKRRGYHMPDWKRSPSPSASVK